MKTRVRGCIAQRRRAIRDVTCVHVLSCFLRTNALAADIEGLSIMCYNKLTEGVAVS